MSFQQPYLARKAFCPGTHPSITAAGLEPADGYVRHPVCVENAGGRLMLLLGVDPGIRIRGLGGQ